MAEKKRSYLQFPQAETEAGHIECKRIRAIRETRRINRNSWDTCVSNMEHDVRGFQETAYKMLRELNKTEEIGCS
jgi:hypothetical protein